MSHTAYMAYTYRVRIEEEDDEEEEEEEIRLNKKNMWVNNVQYYRRIYMDTRIILPIAEN